MDNRKTIHGISLTMLEWLNPSATKYAESVGTFNFKQVSQMPDYFRLAMQLLLALIGLTCQLRHGRSLDKLDFEKRNGFLKFWRKISIGPLGEFLKFFESFTAYAYYTHTLELASETFPAAALSHAIKTIPTTARKFEVVIIGSGPGGAVTAAMTAQSGKSTLVIEEGSDRRTENVIPFSSDELARSYRNGGITMMWGNPKLNYAEGSVLGGGSEVNAGLYHRTPSEVLTEWKNKFALVDSLENDLRPYFEFHEKSLGITKFKELPAGGASLKLSDGAKAFSWKVVEVPRMLSDSGASKTRNSMTRTYLKEAVENGATILSNAKVTRLHKEGKKWKIELHSGEPIFAENVFVCAGAIHTPHLLRRSGITKNIGNSLQAHPFFRLTAQFEDDIYCEENDVGYHQVKEFAPAMSMGCSVSLPPYLAIQHIQRGVSIDSIPNLMGDWKKQAIYYLSIRPEAVGSVRSIPLFQDPFVRFQVSGNDLKLLHTGFERISKILFQSGAKALYPSIRNFPAIKNLSEMPAYFDPKTTNLMTVHIFSSCPMGEDKSKCAVDSFGKVHGFDNLYINDSSILCSAPGVNPQGSIMAFARRNTLRFLEG